MDGVGKFDPQVRDQRDRVDAVDDWKCSGDVNGSIRTVEPDPIITQRFPPDALATVELCGVAMRCPVLVSAARDAAATAVDRGDDRRRRVQFCHRPSISSVVRAIRSPGNSWQGRSLRCHRLSPAQRGSIPNGYGANIMLCRPIGWREHRPASQPQFRADRSSGYHPLASD